MRGREYAQLLSQKRRENRVVLSPLSNDLSNKETKRETHDSDFALRPFDWLSKAGQHPHRKGVTHVAPDLHDIISFEFVSYRGSCCSCCGVRLTSAFSSH